MNGPWSVALKTTNHANEANKTTAQCLIRVIRGLSLTTDHGLLTTDFFHSYNRNMHPLSEKVALITGGSSGIGRATALRLASHGGRVVVAARDQTALEEVVREVENKGGQALAAP